MPTSQSKSPAARPAGAKAPSDRRPSADDLRAEALADRPAGADLLRDPASLRARDRQKVLSLATDLAASSSAVDVAGLDGATSLTAEQVNAIDVGLDMVAKVDELLEEFAIDADEYASWATVAGGGPQPGERIIELFSWYAAALGE